VAEAADQAPRFINPSSGRTHNTKDGRTSFESTSRKPLFQNLHDTSQTGITLLQQVTVVNITFQPVEVEDEDEWHNIMFSNDRRTLNQKCSKTIKVCTFFQ